MRSKILYVSRDLTHMYFHLTYIKYLIKEGNEVHIACEINKNTEDFISEGIEVHHIDFARKAISINHKIAYNQLKELYEKENYDLIHFHTPIAAFIGRCAARKIKTKTVYTAHGLHFYHGAPISNWIIYYTLEKIAAKWTDAIVLINAEDYNLVKNKFTLRNNGNVYYINGVGIDLELFNNMDAKQRTQYKEKLNISDDEMVISCVGELNKNKNQIQLLQALNLSKNKDKINLLIIGEGEEEVKLIDYCEKTTLNNVQFLGYRRDVPNILSISDVLALVSKREGLPKSIMEGMASSLALLGTNTRGTRDLIEDNVNGYIVEVGDFVSLSKKIDVLYENKDKLNLMKKKSFLLSSKYESSCIIDKLDEIYRKLKL